MVYTDLIREAVSFAIKTHEIDQKQLRKGKDIPYITHPLTVGIIFGPRRSQRGGCRCRYPT